METFLMIYERGVEKMDMLNRLNQFIEKWIFLVTPVCVVIGVAFSDITIHGNIFVPAVFAIMTFIGALKSTFRDVAEVFKRPLPLVVSLFGIHVVMPLMAYGLGMLLFQDNPNLITGMILEFAVPSAVVALMWVTIYHGNGPLSLSLVIMDTLLAPFLIPLTLRILVGSRIRVDTVGMMEELILMIALPAVLAMALNQMSMGKVKETWPGKLALLSKLCLMYVQICNSAKAAPYIRNLNRELIETMAVILLLASIGYLLGWLGGMFLRENRKTKISMIYGVGMRNISAGAVIASAYFPAEVVFPVITATLFQQILAAAYGVLIKKYLLKERV